MHESRRKGNYHKSYSCEVGRGTERNPCLIQDLLGGHTTRFII